MPFFDEIARGSNQLIHFTSVATGAAVAFPAFITQFSDNYSVSWGGTSVFGRMDPIKNYQSTGRRINCAFDILGKDKETAIENFVNYSKLIKMMYPVYSSPVGPHNKSRTIKAAPLLRIKYANYLRSEISEHGVLGCIQGVTFQPKFETGHFLTDSGATLIPISYSMTFTFEPLHETPLGFDESGQFLSENFPYNQESANTRKRKPGGTSMDGADNP
jgi:hypothetical protein